MKSRSWINNLCLLSTDRPYSLSSPKMAYLVNFGRFRFRRKKFSYFSYRFHFRSKSHFWRTWNVAFATCPSARHVCYLATIANCYSS